MGYNGKANNVKSYGNNKVHKVVNNIDGIEIKEKLITQKVDKTLWLACP